MQIQIVLLFCFSIGLISGLTAQNVNISQGLVFEGEPFIAQNPNNPNHLVVAWMGFKFGQKVIIKTKSSFNGGQSWSATAELTHSLSDHNSADPSLAFHGNGDLYVCYVDYDNVDFLTGHILVAKSTDGGLNWGSPVIALDATSCPNKLCVDRPWMVIDNSGGPHDGRIYITTMNADQPIVQAPYHPYLSVSSNGGVSFDFVGEIDAVNYLAGQLIKQPMPTPAVDANGRFLTIYPSYVLAQSVFGQNFMVSSTDGGVTYSHSQVNTVTQGFSETQTKKGYLLKAHPSVPERLAFVYPSEQSGDLDVFLQESFDGGDTWSAAIRVNDDAINNGVLQDLVWADYNTDGDLMVCWRDRRNGGAGFDVSTEIFGAVKFNGQPNFSNNFPLTDQLISHNTQVANSGNDFLSVAMQGDTAHVVWGDVRSGVINIYYNKTSITNPTTSIQTITTADWRFATLYPNPADDVVYLKELSEFNYTIFDLSGLLVKQGKGEINSIRVEELATGTYTIIIETSKFQGGYRFIKR
jgi:hypothetical protein